jgi:plasmid stabilization system protein ParE
VKARFLKAAREELREAVRYYDAQRPGLGTVFRDEVRATVERIKALPDAWHPLSANTRRCRTHRFPYGVIYQPRGHEIVIVAVAHLHQEPGRWKDRL